MRYFEKISLKQYIKDGGQEDSYNEIQKPQRATVLSAGYDICTPVDILLPARSAGKFPTGLRVIMNDDEVLLIHIRSSIGAKHGVRISNSTGIIDADYSQAQNEGHMWLFLHNDSDKDFVAKSGDRLCQGIFSKYFVTDDDVAVDSRVGGVGSTGK